MEKKLIGLVEKIKIIGEKTVETFALFDTGAQRTSIDTRLVERARLGEPISEARIKHASWKNEIKRPIVRAEIKIKNMVFSARVSVQDRAHMAFPVIIGRDILAGNFIVDPNKNQELFRSKRGKTGQANIMKYVS